MKPEILGALADVAIPFFGGIYATLLAYRVVGKQAGESFKYDDWHQKACGIFKVLGPLLVAFSVLMFIGRIM